MTVVPRTEELLTTKQLALHYGFSVRWVNRWVALGMPRRIIGGQNRFLVSQVDAFFAERQEKAA